MLHQQRDNWVRQAFIVLQQHEPDFFEHATRVFDRWEYDPTKCHNGAWACTGGTEQWGVLMFKKDPLTLSLLDLSALIGHESLHYGMTRGGSLVQINHQCRDPLCSHPTDMTADPIYRAHRALYSRLAAKIAAVYHPFAKTSPPPSQNVWSTEKKILVAVGAAAAVFGAIWLGPKIVGAIAAA